MNYLQQFGTMLDGIEDTELKTKLITAFGNVKLDFNTSIENRNIAKQELQNYKTAVSQKLGTDDIESFKIPEPSADLEKMKVDLETKYNNDLNVLRDERDGFKSKHDEVESNLNDYRFMNELEKQGMFEGFMVKNPRVKDMLVSEFKDKLVLEDGNFYVKDSNGEKQRDISSGDFLKGSKVSDDLKSAKEWLDFVEPNSRVQGSGAIATTTTGNKNPQDYSEQERVDLYRTNPTKFQELFGKK